VSKREPEMIEITERQIDPLDLCQYNTPMSFCRECGTWMNCKRDGIDVDWRRRPEEQP
jgi:hypothetical protein